MGEAKAIGDLIPTALSLEPVGNVLTQLQTTDPDKRLELALASQKMQTISEPDLKNVLRYVFAVVGIRGGNLPVDQEKEFLHNYIRKFYGNHTADEVRMAFDMAIQNRLECDPRCFENFSPEYFARIMNAFRRWAAVEERRLETRKRPEPTVQDKEKIDAEYRDYLISEAFQKFGAINKLPSTTKRLKQWKKGL